ncbi:MAG TPA: LysM peptidoglycan-binding domain-containing protein [Dissulfurispiraceae bacterium]|nr:LysM peptidoglycan-binding domain-containing protein [Dissulfurispiraceae bacterium]
MRNWIVAVSLVSLICARSYADADAKTMHTVQKGDTLQKISKRYHISIPDLKSANNLSSVKLAIGDRIVIPEKGTAAASQADTPRKEKSALKAVAEKSTYAVKKGDNVATIARLHGMSESELMAVNGLKSAKLKPGQQLTVKKAVQSLYTVKEGDNIWSIARKHNMSVNQLKEINGLSDSTLQVNQKLAVAKKEHQQRTHSTEADDEHAERAAYDPKTTPIIASAKIAEVKELSRTEEVADMNLQDRLLLFARKMLHLPYRFGGNGIAAVDCSSYVQKVFSIAGIQLPRSAREQFRVGEEVHKSELNVGDLVFFQTYASFPSHVGIYMGNNLFIHASSREKRVTIDNLNHPYYVSRYIGAKRLLPEAELEGLELQLMPKK